MKTYRRLVFRPLRRLSYSGSLVNSVMLPGGHTAPDARGFSHARADSREPAGIGTAITPQPIPTKGPEQPWRLVIPSIGVDHPIVAGDDWEL